MVEGIIRNGSRFYLKENFQNTKFENTNLKRACMVGLNLSNASFKNSNIEEANFIYSNLKNTKFENSNIELAYPHRAAKQVFKKRVIIY